MSIDKNELFVDYLMRLKDIVGRAYESQVNLAGGYHFIDSMASQHTPVAINIIQHATHGDADHQRMVAKVSATHGSDDVVRDLVSNSFLVGFLAAHPATQEVWRGVLRDVQAEYDRSLEDANRKEQEEQEEEEIHRTLEQLHSDSDDEDGEDDGHAVHEDMDTGVFTLEELLKSLFSSPSEADPESPQDDA